jgi:hypothetical protein
LSEFSDSFHVRAPNRRAVSQRMVSGKVRGVVFPPKNGWCTVVPFEGDDRKVEELARFFALPVLRYIYAEDHGWGFAMAHNGAINVKYEASWDEDVMIDDKNLDINILRPYVLSNVDVRKLETRLRNAAAPEIGKAPLAYEFACAIGLPKFQWLSPTYVTLDFKRGHLPKAATVIGEPDPDPVLPQPAIDKIAVPRSDLSAFEALELVTPKVLEWDPDAHSDLIHSRGDLKRRDMEGPMVSSEGRTREHGQWGIRFISKNNGVIAFVTLAASGEVAIKALANDINAQSWHRPDNSIDSTRLMQITEPIYEQKRKAETAPLFDRIISLRPWGPKERWVWTVTYFCWVKGMRRWDLDLIVDAVSGGLVEQNERTA